MMRFVVSVISLAAVTSAIEHHAPFYSAASEAQIRFAIENKYDDTGPGSQKPEVAYNTYENLEEALIGYLNDPDTKLPEQERNRAIQKFIQPYQHKPDYENQELKRYYPKTVEEYTGYKKNQGVEEFRFSAPSRPKTIEVYNGYRQPPQAPIVLTKLYTGPPKKYYYPGHQDSFTKKEIAEPYRLESIKRVKHPQNIAHFDRDPDVPNVFDQFDTNPKYTFSYGVHVPDTGDSKTAHETRDGSTVRGFYRFIDPDGKLRTVNYTADDKHGFRASVERVDQ